MTSSLVDLVLLAALVLTSACVLSLYRKLKRLDRYHSDFQKSLARSVDALSEARTAVQNFNLDGRELAGALDERIAEARAVLAELDRRRAEVEEPPANRAAAPVASAGAVRGEARTAAAFA